MKWQLARNQALRLRSWDNEFVVYNSLSGDTHLIGPAAADILTLLKLAPTDAPSLANALSSAWRTDGAEEFLLQVEDILADLRKLELIERAG